MRRTGDELFPKLILITTFLGVTTLFFWSVTPLVTSGAMLSDPELDWDALGFSEYNLYDPDPFEVSNATITDTRSKDNYAVEFTDPLSTPHRHDIKAWVIRDNFWYTPLTVQLSTRYQDYIALQMNLESIPTLPYTSKQAAISFETILEWADYENNMSEIDIHLNADYILFISTGPGMPISTGLWANEFNMSIGWSVNLSATATASPWGLIGQILTFSIPDVSPLINLLLGIPIYMTLAFLIAAIISRFVPTVGGL